jgi:hypothetical protein
MGQYRTTWDNMGPLTLGGGFSIDSQKVSGWWFFATPLKNDGVRQLG